MERPVYLDYNGTTPIDPEVVLSMRQFLEDDFGNPSSSHLYGIEPKRAVARARQQVASLIGCAPREVIFTSGGTESNNFAIFGTTGFDDLPKKKIITSCIEHPAIMEPLRYLESRGLSVCYIPVDSSGILNLDELESAIDDKTVLITVMHSNNEVGSIQPIELISGMAKSKNIVFHTDACQSLGKVSVDVNSLGVDLLTIAGHKVYGPKGVGALYVREGTEIKNVLYGAGQEMGRRPGTENVAGIAGLGMACEIAQRNLAENSARMKRLRERLRTGLESGIRDLRFNGHPENSLPNTLNVSFKGIEANRLLEEIGLEVAVSAGAACHSDHVMISHVLKAMNVPLDYAKGTVRFSLGKSTTEDEIDKTIKILSSAAAILRK